jgi:phospholipid transport system substrate-binding protein
MKNKLLAIFLIFPTLAPVVSMAATSEIVEVNKFITPTSALTNAVELLISVAGNKALSDEEKKIKITEIVIEKVDLPVASQRVVSRHWKKATTEEKKEFISLFTQVIVNTYANVLNKYTNEKVEYLNEDIRKEKYARVTTNIITIDKKIPVNYKLLLRNDQWRIYDFSAEGISLISTYTNDFKSTLKRGGLAGLNEVLRNKVADEES